MVAGAGLAWWWLQGDAPMEQSTQQPMEGSIVPEQVAQPTEPAYRLDDPDSIVSFLLQADDVAISEVTTELAAAGRYQEAVELMLNAIASTEDEERYQSLVTYLQDWLPSLESELASTELMDLYQVVVWQLPRESVFLLQLGRLQLAAGQYGAGMQTLAQISYDPLLGEQARQLMADADGSEEAIAGMQIPLDQRGSQFLVTAQIDGHTPLRLLIDTGAAVTVIKPEVLAAAGYDLAAAPIHRFATAGCMVDARVTLVQALRIGDAEVTSLSVGALPLLLPEDVDGLLGMNFLGLFSFSINQAEATLLLNQRSEDDGR